MTAAAVALLASGCSGNDGGSGSAASPSASAATASPSAPAPSTASPAASPAATTPAAPTTPSSPSSPPTVTEPVTLSTISGGVTELTIDQGFLDALRIVRIQLEPVGGAQSSPSAGGTTFSFPVTGGSATIDPAQTEPIAGRVQHRGGLQLSGLGRSATLQDLVLDGDRGQLLATVAGQRVPLLPLDAAGAQITREDGQVVITDEAVALDSGAAEQLAQQLGLPALPSVDLGQLRVTLRGNS